MKISIGAIVVMGVCALACGAEDPATTSAAGRGTTSATATWEPEVFPISYWSGPPKQFNTRERYQEIADAGFTYAMQGPEGGGTPEDNKLTLDHCQAVGIKAFLWDSRMPNAIGGDASVKKNIDAIVADYAKHPAFAGYFIGDEPSAAAFPGLGEVFAYLVEKDPEHPTYVNLYPNYCPQHGLGTATYDEYIQQWLKIVRPAILSYDHYHFRNKFDQPGFFANLHTVRRESLKSGVPFWQIALLINHFDYRSPNEAEKRFEAMQTLVFGGKGFMYFTYWQPVKDWGEAIFQMDGRRTKHYDEVKRINHDVQAIGKYLLKAKSVDVWEYGQAGDRTNTEKDIVRFDGPNITVGQFEAAVNVRYVMFANRDYRKPAETSVTIDTDGKTLEQLNKQTGEWTVVERVDGKIRLKLGAGDGELFRWR